MKAPGRGSGCVPSNSLSGGPGERRVGDLVPCSFDVTGKSGFPRPGQGALAPGSSAASVPTISSPEAASGPACSLARSGRTGRLSSAFVLWASSGLWSQENGTKGALTRRTVLLLEERLSPLPPAGLKLLFGGKRVILSPDFRPVWSCLSAEPE